MWDRRVRAWIVLGGVDSGGGVDVVVGCGVGFAAGGGKEGEWLARGWMGGGVGEEQAGCVAGEESAEVSGLTGVV